MADEITAEQIAIVRTLIPDTDAVFGPGEDEHLFSDEDITRFITAAGGSVTRAAGFAMIAVGNSEALINKVIKTQDLMTNGAATAIAFRQAGEAMLKRADKEEQNQALDYFEIVDYREGWSADRPELTEWVTWA